MRKLLAVFLVLCVVVGCDSPEVIRTNNAKELRDGGEVVGTLPDGREVRRYRIERENASDHWVYVVGDTVTVNRVERHGKPSTHHTEVYSEL